MSGAIRPLQYVLKVEVVLKAGVESSIEIGLSLGSEDISQEGQEANPNDAPFVALDFMFNGVKVYLEKEIQVSLKKRKKDSTNDSNLLFGGEPSESDTDDDLPDASNKEAQKYEKTWLKISNKHQFKYYLNKDDREEIKAQKALEKERLESENTT